MEKDIRTVIKIVPRYLYPFFEKYLSKMSAEGWHLVKYRYPFFTFARGETVEKKYFVYQHGGGHTRDDGWVDLDLRYPLLFKTYAVKAKKSPLNTYGKKVFPYLAILEVDETKLDFGFDELCHDRNKYGYLRLLFENAIFILPLLYFAFTSEQRFFRIGCFAVAAVLLLNLLTGLIFTRISNRSR